MDMFEIASDDLLLLLTLSIHKINSWPSFAMPVLGDDFQEGGYGPFDVLPIMGTVIAILASVVMIALAYNDNSNAGGMVDGGGNRGDPASVDLALSDDVVEETQDKLISAEEGWLDGTPSEQRPKRPRAHHSIANANIIGKKIVYLLIKIKYHNILDNS